MQLHQQHLAALTQCRPTAFEALHPWLGGGQPPEVGEPAMGFHGHGETLGQPGAPAGEGAVPGPPVEARVELHGVEHLHVAGQAAGGG